MTSKRKIMANRKNARKSTGPKTSRGKQLSSLNAVKEGAYAHSMLLPSENSAAFVKLVNAVADDLEPKGILEHTLYNQVLKAIIRLQRLERAASAYIEGRIQRNAIERILLDKELQSRSECSQNISYEKNQKEKAIYFSLPKEIKLEKSDIEEALLDGFRDECAEIDDRIDRRRRALVRDIIRMTKDIEDLQARRMKKELS